MKNVNEVVDIILKDIFQNSLKNYKSKEKYYFNSNNFCEGNINRKFILSKITNYIKKEY